MFGRQTRKEIKRLGASSQAQKSTLSRRATSALAPASEWRQVRNTQSRYLNHQSLFLAFEGNKSTCCIHISSPAQKSRASLILFRGRVLSCIYGKRDIPYYTYSLDAFQSIKLDLAHPDSEFSVQAMTEEMALASASVFEGKHKSQGKNVPIKEFFLQTYEAIASSKQPGCILIKDDEQQTRFVVYLFDGDIIGFYSYKDGWIKSTYDHVLKKITRTQGLTAQAFILETKMMDALYDQTFSLTDMPSTIDEKRAWVNARESTDALNVFEAHAQPPTLRNTFKFTALHPTDQHRIAIESVAAYSQRSSSRGHAHFVDPLNQR